jgi:hypothetical protein
MAAQTAKKKTPAGQKKISAEQRKTSVHPANQHVDISVTALDSSQILFVKIFSDSLGKYFFTYPVSMLNQEALQELQKSFIKQRFGNNFLGQGPVAALLSLYKNQYKELDRELEFFTDNVSFPLPGIAQYETSLYVYSHGGTHGLTISDVGIYSISDGKKIEFGSIFNKNWENDIVKLIIKEFLLSQNLQSIFDYNYTQKESDFVPSNARVVIGGLEFLYPIYKIAPYAAGEQSVFLSWSTLKPYLNPRSAIYHKIDF